PDVAWPAAHNAAPRGPNGTAAAANTAGPAGPGASPAGPAGAGPRHPGCSSPGDAAGAGRSGASCTGTYGIFSLGARRPDSSRLPGQLGSAVPGLRFQ